MIELNSTVIHEAGHAVSYYRACAEYAATLAGGYADEEALAGCESDFEKARPIVISLLT